MDISFDCTGIIHLVVGIVHHGWRFVDSSEEFGRFVGKMGKSLVDLRRHFVGYIWFGRNVVDFRTSIVVDLGTGGIDFGTGVVGSLA